MVVLPPAGTSLSCEVVNNASIRCANISDLLVLLPEYSTVVPTTPTEDHRMFWFWLCGYVVLVLFAGLVSGLTLAILSLDVMSLQVMLKGGSAKDKKYAQRILPLSQRHHWVLVALVIANSLAVEAMPLVLDEIAIRNIVSSVRRVLPQAVCSRYGLTIGYHLAWIVWTLVCLFFVIVWPVAKLLDLLLGKQHGTFYRRAELLALVDLHGPSSRSPYGKAPQLTMDEVNIIKSAVEMTSKRAHHLLRPLNQVYMLSIDSVFDETTLREILESGHSRIPIFEAKDPIDIVGVVLAKKLILADPKEKMPVRVAMKRNFNNAFTEPYFVSENEKVHDMLDVFQAGTTHMAFVRRMNAQTGKKEICGIITLEHIIEILLREDIWDETDKLRNESGSKRLKLIQNCFSTISDSCPAYASLGVDI